MVKMAPVDPQEETALRMRKEMEFETPPVNV
jgi:hypothetical protein